MYEVIDYYHHIIIELLFLSARNFRIKKSYFNPFLLKNSYFLQIIVKKFKTSFIYEKDMCFWGWIC